MIFRVTRFLFFFFVGGRKKKKMKAKHTRKLKYVKKSGFPMFSETYIETKNRMAGARKE